MHLLLTSLSKVNGKNGNGNIMAGFICWMLFLLSLTFTTNVFAAQAQAQKLSANAVRSTPNVLTWTPLQLLKPDGKPTDVFDLLVTTSGGLHLWANARHVIGSNYASTYIATDLKPPPFKGWLLCGPVDGLLRQAGIFGVDRTDFSNSMAYVPTGPNKLGGAGGLLQMFAVTSPTLSCQAQFPYSPPSNSDDVAAYLQTSPTNGYYAKINEPAPAPPNDVMMVNNNLPDPLATWNSYSIAPGLQINYIDGSDTSPSGGKVFLATNQGLFSCSDYPICSSWNENSQLGPIPLHRVLYTKDMPTVAESVLVVGGDFGLDISTDEGSNWVHVTPSRFGPVVSGIAADSTFIYVTSFGLSSSVKARDRNKYSLRNLLKDCGYEQSKILQGIVNGGLTIYQYDGMKWVEVGSYSVLEMKAKSNVILGVSLYVPGSCAIAERIYVPWLGSGCNNGGFSYGDGLPPALNPGADKVTKRK